MPAHQGCIGGFSRRKVAHQVCIDGFSRRKVAHQGCIGGFSRRKSESKGRCAQFRAFAQRRLKPPLQLTPCCIATAKAADTRLMLPLQPCFVAAKLPPHDCLSNEVRHEQKAIDDAVIREVVGVGSGAARWRVGEGGAKP